ncbi:MAG: capsule assembly Wzi family protein [Opitutae bacterium]|nr:capsule assembly Wzi family protein [Opitutae bacterium]
MSPDDPFLRHELRWLRDNRLLDAPLNTWPISWGGIDVRLKEDGQGSVFDRVRDCLDKEREAGWGSTIGRIGFRGDRGVARSFQAEPRVGFSGGIERAWMGDRLAGKLRLANVRQVEPDWRGRVDDGFQFDGSYFATRLGNWSASFGQTERSWGPGWDGSLILSTNARPVPAFSIDRRIPEPFETKWLSWIGPWNATMFVGQMEENRDVSEPYVWGMRAEFAPTILDGLEIGLFRVMQLGGEGRPSGFKTWTDAFLSQDNYGANSKHQDKWKEPGNQLAGIDFRWRPLTESSFALYGQVVGEDEDHFLPNALMFQYGIETWGSWESSTWRMFLEYADTTSTWWTDEIRQNASYNHGIYTDGYRHHGRSVGHWADSDSEIVSFGGLLANYEGNGWGGIVRAGKLNRDGGGNSAVSNSVATDIKSVQLFHKRSFSKWDAQMTCGLGWEELENSSTQNTENGPTGFLSIARVF